MGSGESRSPHLFSRVLPLVPPQDHGVTPTPGTGVGTAAACSRPTLLRALVLRPTPAPTPAPLPPSPLCRLSSSRFAILASRMEQYIQGQSRDLIYKADAKLCIIANRKNYFARSLLEINKSDKRAAYKGLEDSIQLLLFLDA